MDLLDFTGGAEMDLLSLTQTGKNPFCEYTFLLSSGITRGALHEACCLCTSGSQDCFFYFP